MKWNLLMLSGCGAEEELEMRLFLKLNAISALYGLLFFIEIELVANIYRISRVTGWDINRVDKIVFILNIAIFILSTVLFVYVTYNYMNGMNLRYFSAIMWFPYLALYIYVLSSCFPITDPGEQPSHGLGIIGMGALIIYPFYIVFINMFGFTEGKSNSG
ncbi:hypothetical protein [Paenibacillus monticola]|uniref:Uncharacterized protein n=1 Tax=Paenibacillus monticola TaxID=2666075 RepID=A0A7X2H340_9BACL|nr:hypothetical protein [Paenibacillus monticola]MRN52679.1 hypothetical protein [Paenibacillus monticola]